MVIEKGDLLKGIGWYEINIFREELISIGIVTRIFRGFALLPMIFAMSSLL